MKDDKFDENVYKEDANRYKKIFYSSAVAANQALTFLMMMAFYEIGEDIQKKGIWVEEYIKRVSNEFPEHKIVMSKQNIGNMCKLSQLIDAEEIINLRLFELGWSELIPLIQNSENHDEFITNIGNERNKGEA